jgi:hypothetical protein
MSNQNQELRASPEKNIGKSQFSVTGEGDFSIDYRSSNVCQLSNFSEKSEYKLSSREEPLYCIYPSQSTEKISLSERNVSKTVTSQSNVFQELNISESIYKEDHYFFLEKIRNEIDKMEKIHHIKILKILKEYKNVKLNENKSGVFVNLSFLPKEAIDNIVNYLEYIREQEKYISNLENQQESLKVLLNNDGFQRSES